ncbi:hypothetical protein DM02DRAFT_730538 [Periconia macrospinosa]|uniref:Uncharacterized protein n=1 Tax=Periconia macrospinosa TaxID=97972 RepID=A0A2V1DIU7_9PLEO|nr:hypothetical protein DM02DRAFT_730538 [Periconia macrospinosa]
MLSLALLGNRHVLLAFAIVLSLLQLVTAAVTTITEPFSVAHPVALSTWTPAYRVACDPGHEQYYCTAKSECYFDAHDGAFACCKDHKNCIPVRTCVGVSTTTTAPCKKDDGCLKCNDAFLGNCLTKLNPVHRIYGIQCNSRSGTITYPYSMDFSAFPWPLASDFPWSNTLLTTTDTLGLPSPTATPSTISTPAPTSPPTQDLKSGEKKESRNWIAGIVLGSVFGTILVGWMVYKGREAWESKRKWTRELTPSHNSIPLNNMMASEEELRPATPSHTYAAFDHESEIPSSPTSPATPASLSPLIRVPPPPPSTGSPTRPTRPRTITPAQDISRSTSSVGTSILDVSRDTLANPSVTELPPPLPAPRFTPLSRSTTRRGLFTPPRGPPPATLPPPPPADEGAKGQNSNGSFQE